MELQRTQGAKVKLALEIEAEAAGGFDDSEVSVVRDNAKQLKFKPESTGCYVGWVEEIPGTLTQGRSLDECRKNLRTSLLLMVEVSLALLARLNSQLHIMMLAFPIKMLLGLSLFAWLLLIFPKVFTQSTVPAMQLVRSLLAT